MAFERIDITDIEGFHIGNAESIKGGTGCTVIICEEGATAGVDVRGGGPATRETDLLKSENTVDSIHSVVLSGGSAYGLEAGSGVMEFLEQKGVGFKVGEQIVPIVCQASLFDLEVGDGSIRPNKEFGIQACKNAYQNIFSHGNHGAGTGASVGKLFGMKRAMKTGLGTYACSDDVLHVGAVTAVNAVGDVYSANQRLIAGLLNEDKTAIEGSLSYLRDSISEHSNPDEKEELGYTQSFNTTISCLITNARLTKPQANKIASILHDGYARAIRPVHSALDGDTIFVMSTGRVDVDFNAFASLATDTIQYSVVDAAASASSAYGLIAAEEFLTKKDKTEEGAEEE